MNDQKNKEFSEGISSVEIDEFRLQRYLQEIRDNQNLLIGFMGGIGAATIGAVIWAIITAAKNYQIGWMAVGGRFPHGNEGFTGVVLRFHHIGKVFRSHVL